MSKQLVKHILTSESFWTLSKPLVYSLGLETAFLLINFTEAEAILSDDEGWFYQTQPTVESLTTLSRHKQDQCIKQLVDAGILEQENRGMPMKRYFRIDYNRVSTLVVENQHPWLSKISNHGCRKSATIKNIYKESNNKEKDTDDYYAKEVETQEQEQITKEKDIAYKEVYEYYLSLGLIQHRAYTKDIAKAIKKGMTDNKYSIDYAKELLDRHKEVVKITSKRDFPVRARGLAEFFGQKAYKATHLICSEYEEGGKLYEEYLKGKCKDKDRPERKIIIDSNYLNQ